MSAHTSDPAASLRHVVIITGPGGSGKSCALNALEDSGYYCLDNLPIALLDAFIELVYSKADIHRVALVVDVRDKHFFADAPDTIGRAIDAGVPIELVFLDADDDTLVRRYSETRRRHPLSEGGAVRDGIAAERLLLQSMRAAATTVIETSRLTGHQLRRVFTSRYGDVEESGIALSVMSFGFKHGVPLEADTVLDVRFLPNPYYVRELRGLRGTDDPVRSFVLSAPEAGDFLSHVDGLIRFLIPLYEREGKPYFTLAVGCTGGHHRSVALAEAIGDSLLSTGYKVRVGHRDIGR